MPSTGLAGKVTTGNDAVDKEVTFGLEPSTTGASWWTGPALGHTLAYLGSMWSQGVRRGATSADVLRDNEALLDLCQDKVFPSRSLEIRFGSEK